MNHQSEPVAEKRRELISIAASMLAGEMNLIEGVRQICVLRFAVEDPENELFLALRGVESETDNFPLGSMRESCSPEYLKRIDSEMQNYLANAQGEILQACREIVKTFSNP